MFASSMFYSEIYWTVSLQAVAHFVKLRDHAGAQSEIQEFSQAVAKLTEQRFPKSFQALVDHL